MLPILPTLAEQRRDTNIGALQECPVAKRDLALLPPSPCLGQRREGLADRFAVPCRPDLGLVARGAQAAAAALSDRTGSGVAQDDSFVAGFPLLPRLRLYACVGW